ncbi:MAG: sterol desaturase family protein [Bacteroidota bacterium]|nr:sterol desaturase family protein [Bacteroidota bacterium]
MAFSEWFLSRKTKQGLFTKQNTLMNMSIGAIDQIFSLAHFVLFILFLDYMYDNYRIFTLKITWYHWIICYVAIDFVSYWYHRFSHRINILWAGHVTHHSSSYFNFTNGFRTSPFQGLNRILFWGILPILGFSTSVLFTTFIISGIYDFFLHTQNFPKIKWLETIFITPSLHKVHHGKNDVYIDKNYGSTFVIWDKLFGTFQDETEPVVYGIISENYKDNDPVQAIFLHYRYLLNMMKRIASWKNKLKLLFMPPDWIPDDLNKNEELVLKMKVETNKLHKVYGFYQFISSSLGILFILVYKNILNPFVFGLLAAIFLTGMITGTKILTDAINHKFERNELIRNLLFLMCLFFCIGKIDTLYVLPIFCFLLFSLFFLIFFIKIFKKNSLTN